MKVKTRNKMCGNTEASSEKSLRVILDEKEKRLIHLEPTI